MDAAFDDMFDILNGCESGENTAESANNNEYPDDNIADDYSDDGDAGEAYGEVEDAEYNHGLCRAMEEMRELIAPQVNAAPKRHVPDSQDFDAENNVLDPIVREDFRTECVFEETDIFSSPVSTTNTMEGYLSNVSFHEQHLIQELIPDEDLVIYRCNYGKIKYDFYSEPVKYRRTNRGRKKKVKKKKLRKKQGYGIDFNSQITFVTTSTMNPDPIDGVVLSSAKVYKFKVFRTGKIQLPGVHQHLIDDVIACAQKIVRVLNFHLHAGETDPAKLTKIVNINPVMKNYKFIVKLPPGHIIDMEALRKILFAERARQFDDSDSEDENPPAPPHPPIFLIKYTRQDTKLSAKFTTPIYRKPKKKTRINIFMRGKINILGAFYARVTHQICEYLHWIFETYREQLIVPEGVAVMPEEQPAWEENIEQFTDEEFREQIDGILNWIPDLPDITEEDFTAVMDFIAGVYDETVNIADDYIRGHFRGTDIGDYLGV